MFSLRRRRPEFKSTRFDISEVPEVSGFGMEFLIGSLIMRTGSGSDTLANFGAYIVRNPDIDRLESWANRLVGRGFSEYDYDFTVMNSPLHQDSPYASWGITMHKTKGGPLRFLILPGTSVKDGEIRGPSVTANAIFLNQGTDVDPNLLPTIGGVGQSCVINNGDAVIFDHRQPHAFSLIERDGMRSSNATYTSGPSRSTH